MAIMNKLTAAYVAGLLDGEGCFSIWYKTGGYYGNKRVFDCVIRVGMVNKEIIDWLQSSFGGSVSTMSSPDKGLHRRQAYQWALRSKPVLIEFLRHITPHLRVKKRNAEILLQHLRTFKKSSYHRGRMMTDETFDRRMELMTEMRSLNQKGVGNNLNVQRERLSERTPQEGDAIVRTSE